jgi:hypothetical protein
MDITEPEAKALMAGPLGIEMQKFPLRFCKPVFFGDPPSYAHAAVVRSGTVSLLERFGELFAMTCAHVMEAYRARRAEPRECFFAIGGYDFDPLPQIVAEDRAVDTCAIRLSPEQAGLVLDQRTGIGQGFYPLGPSPPGPVEVGNFVTFGGFPGEYRRLEAVDELSFGTYSHAGARVTDLHSDYLACQFEREFWVRNEMAVEPEPTGLGGLSGGPAFVIRHSHSGIISYEFCGVIYRMHEDSETLYIRRLKSIWFGDEIESR